MAVTDPTSLNGLPRGHGVERVYRDASHPNASAMSWSAVLAGAAAAASLSLILLMLGVGLGLSSVSPWYREGLDASTFGLSTILWLTFTQIVASAAGGYLAGRLRTKWVEVHRDEVYFRDTAHGFLTWAVASLVTAALLTSVIGSILGGGIKAGAAVVGGAVSTATSAAGLVTGSGTDEASPDSGPLTYFVDSLFRRDSDETPAAAADPTLPPEVAERRLGRDVAEVARIFMHAAGADALPPEDARHIARIVSQHTGVSQQEAEQRVTDTYKRMQDALRDAEAAAKDVADKAREASAYGALWLFVSLLIGAFVASLAATFGGRSRDA